MIHFLSRYLAPLLAIGLIGGCLSVLSATTMAGPRQPPAMEAGVGTVGQYLADYRGSERYRLYVLPLPYFLYHGEFIKLDRDGLRGEVFNNERIKLNLSVDGSLNGKSDDNKRREGMPELATALEVGPSLNINLTGRSMEEGFAVRLPLRGVLTLDSSGLDYIGYLVNPRLTWRTPNIGGHWRLSINYGVLYGSERYHDYYYSVDKPYAMPGRGPYQAPAGYSGQFLRFAFYKKVNRWRFALRARYDTLAGVAFADSPLMETRNFASLSFAIAYRFWTNHNGVILEDN